MDVYLEWAGVKGKEMCIEKLPPETFDIILQEFFAEIVKMLNCKPFFMWQLKNTSYFNI